MRKETERSVEGDKEGSVHGYVHSILTFNSSVSSFDLFAVIISTLIPIFVCFFFFLRLNYLIFNFSKLIFDDPINEKLFLHFSFFSYFCFLTNLIQTFPFSPHF